MTAADKILQKALVGSGLDSRQWSAVQAGLRDRAFFSATVEDVRVLGAFRTACARLAAGEIAKEGVALHYEGGTVRPTDGGKALAIPLDASVYGKKPSEWSGFRRGDEPGDDDVLSVFWPKNSAHGFLKERDTGNLLYLLVPSVTLRADRSVLPEDGELLDAAQEGIMEAVA